MERWVRRGEEGRVKLFEDEGVGGRRREVERVEGALSGCYCYRGVMAAVFRSAGVEHE